MLKSQHCRYIKEFRSHTIMSLTTHIPGAVCPRLFPSTSADPELRLPGIDQSFELSFGKLKPGGARSVAHVQAFSVDEGDVLDSNEPED